MVFDARVIQVMIASPGDVNEEREEIRRILHSWNDLHAANYKVVLLPVGWDTHSSSDLSGRPQEIINKRLLNRCDLLVGVFWTRLGTPTGAHDSGTVEEIKKHLQAGRATMVYFSSRPVDPALIENDQYKGVAKFKDWCKGEGLIGTFDSVEDFGRKFERELQHNLRENEYLKSLVKIDKSSSSNELNVASPIKISDLAIDMLKNAVAHHKRMIKIQEYMPHTVFTAGNKDYKSSDQFFGRETYQNAIDQLEKNGLIRDIGYSREVFQVTKDGVLYVDQLSTP